MYKPGGTPQGHSAAGRSLQEIMWEELVKTTRELIADGTGREPEAVGYARGIAYSLAVLRDPYHIKRAFKAIREEAVERAQSQ